MSINIIHNPITSTALLKLRDKKSHSKVFREGLLLLSEIIAYEAGKKLKTKKVKVKSILEDTVQESISDDIVLIPILRAGLGMIDGVTSVIPNAKIGHIGMYRNEETLEPTRYYYKAPKGLENREVIILDPMLATGGSGVDAISALKESGAKKIKFLCIIAKM